MSESTLPAWIQQGLELQNAGRTLEAESVFRQVLAGEPNNSHALHLLGLLLARTGRVGEALPLLERSVTLQPNVPPFYNNFGEALWESGQVPKAIDAWKAALSIDGNYPNAHMNMGRACEAFGAFEAAENHYRRVTQLQPGNISAMNKLANVMARRGQLDEPIRIWEQISSINPNDATARVNAGSGLAKAGRLDEAMVHLELAVRLAPNALATHMNLGMALLEAGRLPEGFRECDNYWASMAANSHRVFRKPAWDGSPLAGRTILLYTDQNIDDAIQWARFAVLLAQQGGKVILECHGDLLRLFKSIKGITVIAAGEEPPPYDVVCELARVPALVGMDQAALDVRMPYLTPYKSVYENFRDELTRMGPRRKVGLVWAPPMMMVRKGPNLLPLGAFTALLARQDLIFVNLQTGPARDEIATTASATPIVDWTDRLKDLSDYAALIACLDLLIAVDCPLAHLGGAMARRVWMLLPSEGANWRWGLSREESYWYPKMRLLRQKTIGDWSNVIDRVNAGIVMQ